MSGGGGGHHDQNILYEKRIFNKNKKFKKQKEIRPKFTCMRNI